MEITKATTNSCSLQHRIASMRQSFFDEGLLDSFFVQMEDLKGFAPPGFVEEMVNTFVIDSAPKISAIEEQMDAVIRNDGKECVDLNAVAVSLIKLRSGGASIGAAKIRAKANEAWASCKDMDWLSAKAALQEVKTEIQNLKSKLEPYFQLLREAEAVELAEAAAVRNDRTGGH